LSASAEGMLLGIEGTNKRTKNTKCWNAGCPPQSVKEEKNARKWSGNNN